MALEASYVVRVTDRRPLLSRLLFTCEANAPYIYLCRPVHTLDDAHGGRGWLENACHSMALEESPLGPPEAPTADRDQRGEVAA